MSHRTPELGIITCVNTINSTMMPYNEFSKYRAERRPSEEHHVIALDARDSSYKRKEEKSGLPDNLHLHDAEGSARKVATEISNITEGLREQERRIVLHAHHPRVGIVALTYARTARPDVNTLFTVHNQYPRYPAKSKVGSTLCFLAADRTTFVSEASHDAYPGTLQRLNNDTHTIQNGINLDRINAFLKERPSQLWNGLGSSDDTFRIIQTGRIISVKNHEFLLDRIPHLPDALRWTIVGEGGLRPSLERKTGTLGIENQVELTGFLETREEVFGRILSSDLFVNPSLHEGLPLAVMQAMALGRPVLASDIPPHRELAERSDGVKVVPLKADFWEEAVQEFVQADCSELKALGRENRQAVEDHFNLDRMHREYTEVYSQAR